MSIQVDELIGITILTTLVTLGATALGASVGIPVGLLLGLNRFRGRGAVRSLVYALYALPPVVAGLLLYLTLRREGPLGFLDLLFTPTAVLLGEALLTTPLITGLTVAAVADLPAELLESVEVASPEPTQRLVTLGLEARFGIISAVLVGYGRALAEVAAALILGGNIKGETRTLGTAILQEVNRGEFDLALGLSCILIGEALLTAFLLFRFQRANMKVDLRIRGSANG